MGLQARISLRTCSASAPPGKRFSWVRPREINFPARIPVAYARFGRPQKRDWNGSHPPFLAIARQAIFSGGALGVA